MRPSVRSRLLMLIAGSVAVLMLLPATASGHAERDASFPDGNGVTPRLALSGPTLLVCKQDSPQHFATLPIPVRHRNERLYEQCMQDGFRHIQAAVDAVEQKNSRIFVLPGVYREEPSRRAHERGCGEFGNGSNGDERGPQSILTYAEQRKCPHVQNLITIFGDGNGNRECDLPQCGLQIQGTGARPHDVVIDGQFKTLNGIRADRVDGVKFYNFLMQRFEFNALYILETDGFLIDKVIGRWNDEYAFLTFAVDHGRYNRCEGYGNGDSAVYPGSASDINTGKPHEQVQRYAVHVTNCRAHHNAGGYSGTAGNSVHVEKTTFDNNSTGIVTDSIYPNHPGLPQDHAFFENNRIFSNNRNYVRFVQDGTCDQKFINRGYEHGIVCPVIPTPIGTGMIIAGGNFNKVENNRIYDNWRAGATLIHVPAPIREEYDPNKFYDTSHNNRYRFNRMGYGPQGALQPNTVDFWWDDEGEGNCWRDNVARGGPVTENAEVTPTNPSGELPPCPAGSTWTPTNPIKTGQIAACATYNRGDPMFHDPPGCDFFERPPMPENREPARPDYTRLGGKTAAGTATQVSRHAFPGGANAVVVAPTSDQAAALIAAPLAGEVDGPLLLTKRRRLNSTTAAEVGRLDAERAYVVGDTKPKVARMLRDAGVREVTSITADNRYKLAATVARMMGGVDVYVARGNGRKGERSLASSFSIAGLAAYQERPILLTRKNELPKATADALSDMHIVNATLIGKTSRISGAVGKAVDRRAVVLDRLRGFRRYKLSAASARLALQGIADQRRLWVASGTKGLDALVTAPAVAHRDGALLLVAEKSLANSKASRKWLRNNRHVLADVYFTGAARRLSTNTAKQVRAVTSVP